MTVTYTICWKAGIGLFYSLENMIRIRIPHLSATSKYAENSQETVKGGLDRVHQKNVFSMTNFSEKALLLMDKVSEDRYPKRHECFHMSVYVGTDISRYV